MLKIKKQADYMEFMEILKKITDCEVEIKIWNEPNHFHYGLRKGGVPIGVVCYDKGVVTFAPFRTLNDKTADSEYISFVNAPLARDFTKVFLSLSDFMLDK